MHRNQKRMGMGLFAKRAGLSPPVIRGLEAAGVVKPLRTDSGWRAFSEADLRSALNWKDQRRPEQHGHEHFHDGANANAEHHGERHDSRRVK